jgi:hypothetical protein
MPFSHEPIMGSRAGCVWIVVATGAGVGVGDCGGVIVGVTGTAPFTTGGAGVATGAVPKDPVPVHPLMRTIPITRTVKIPIAFHFFIGCSINYCPYSRK